LASGTRTAEIHAVQLVITSLQIEPLIIQGSNLRWSESIA
jgi:hypothetical protein